LEFVDVDADQLGQLGGLRLGGDRAAGCEVLGTGRAQRRLNFRSAEVPRGVAYPRQDVVAVEQRQQRVPFFIGNY
jgi:hypothetical protein